MMETDLQYYTRLTVEARRAARRAANDDMRRAHERRATAFALQMHRLESTPASISPVTRLQPLPLAA